MPERPLSLNVGGQTYRVLTDADPDALQHLADVVDAKLRACNPNGRLSPNQALLYVALALADDLEGERRARQHLHGRITTTLRDLIARADAALDTTAALLPATPNPSGKLEGS